MFTPDPMPGAAVQSPVRRYAPGLLLPEAPRPEDLVQYWTRSARDQVEVRRCRGEANRRRFAVQLCTLRAYGRFLPEATPTPVTITNHLARQLDLPLVLFGDLPERLATETEQLQRIRAYLGWQPFDDAARTRLTHWLTQRATDDILPRDLVERAEPILRFWQMVLPARSTLDTLVVSVTAHVQDALYTRIAAPFTPALQQALDDLLDVPAGARRSMLFQRKEYPPEASLAVILRSIERYQFLQDLGVSSLDLQGLSPAMLRYCADLAKRTDARAFRRFAPAKRYTLTACFLVESHKTILDHLVALHDQLLTKKMREAHHAFAERDRQLRRQYRRGLTKLIATGNTLLDPTRPATTTLATLLEDLDATALRAAVDICTERHQLEERGEIDALRALSRAPPLSPSVLRAPLPGRTWQ